MSGRTLDRLLAGSMARALVPKLEAEPVAVLGWPRLARLLADGRECIALAPSLAEIGDVAPARAVTLEQQRLAATRLKALVYSGPGESSSELRELLQLVDDGGSALVITQGPRHEASRLALCAGVAELYQFTVGRKVITGGQVRRLPAATDRLADRSD